MSFRIEEKLDVSSLQLKDFINWLNTNGAEVLYPKREIESLYFENANNGMFLDSEEGCTPRKKIRVRHYPNDKNIKRNLEIKITSVEGRFKTTNEINKNNYAKIIKNGYLDDLYGICYPKVIINYIREYYSLWGSRITVDYNINYTYLFNATSKRNENRVVVELKSKDMFIKEKLINLFPFKKIRFSKYCRAVLSI